MHATCQSGPKLYLSATRDKRAVLMQNTGMDCLAYFIVTRKATACTQERANYEACIP